MPRKTSKASLDEWRELRRVLGALAIILALATGFCLFRSAVRAVSLFSVARACEISTGRALEIGAHFNNQLRNGGFSVCDVICAKLFSESLGAFLAAMVAGVMITAPLRARQIVARLHAKHEGAGQ